MDLTKSGRRSDLQKQSQEYWRASSHTYLGTASYYDDKERILDEVLTKLAPLGHAYDLGCGDGRYTTLIAKHADVVLGEDISPGLVDQAARRATELGLPNVRFSLLGDGPGLSDQQFDLVSALGVTCCLIDDEEFHGLAEQMAAACVPHGHLILIDTVCRQFAEIMKFPNGYIAHYRQVDAYRDAFERRGFDLVHSEELRPPAAHWSRRLLPRGSSSANTLFCFKRRG